MCVQVITKQHRLRQLDPTGDMHHQQPQKAAPSAIERMVTSHRYTPERDQRRGRREASGMWGRSCVFGAGSRERHHPMTKASQHAYQRYPYPWPQKCSGTIKSKQALAQRAGLFGSICILCTRMCMVMYLQHE